MDGYRYSNSATCKCGMAILWFWTPRNRKMPFSLKIGKINVYEPHFATCRKVKEFRREGPGCLM